jgi:hypothetical protein
VLRVRTAARLRDGTPRRTRGITRVPRRLLVLSATLALAVGPAGAQRPRPGARPARPALQPWWADTTKWPPGTFRRVTTQRPLRLAAVGDTLRFPGPQLPAGLPDSIGRDVRWSAEDPRIVAVQRPAVALAAAAGTTTVTAWTRVGPTLTPVRVVALLRGRLHTADGAAVPRARVVVTRASGRADTLRTDADGRFVSPDSGIAGDPPRALRVEPDDAGWFAAAAPLPAPFAGAAADVVLLPRRWTVPSGTHAGAVVDVDLAAARTRAADGSRFWRSARLRPDSATRESAGPPVGWPDVLRPIAVAVRGDAADSAAFWAVARGVERDWGAPLFRPQPAARALEGGWPGIVVQVAPRLSAAGFATISWNGATGEIAGALVEVRSRALLGDRHVVGHELLHALGFGHVTAWRSVLGGAAHAPSAGPTALSLEDVAYGRLLDAARRVARRTGAPFGLAEAVP